jgi:hypothetical protein
MRPAVGRLVVTILLFAGWLGYLGYLVVCRPHTPGGLVGAFVGRPLTLSRPQLLVSTLDVVARVEDDKGENVVVEEVLYPKEHAPVKAGDQIRVMNLDQCRPLPDPITKEQGPPDFTGPDRYLLPLQSTAKNDDKEFEVAPTPPSPGYPPQHPGSAGPPPGRPGPPRLYPATPEMRAEYAQIAKPQ